jgi:hypothetical protein
MQAEPSVSGLSTIVSCQWVMAASENALW